MNIKKIKIIILILTIILSVISHFIYNLFPGFITSIFFPVNESIWEHMKLIATPLLITSIIEFLMTKNKNIFFINSITIIFSIILYLLIYLPLNYFFNYQSIIAISLLIIIFVIASIISYIMLNSTNNHQYYALPILLTIYIIFGLITYFPPHNFIFYDQTTNSYGLSKEIIS